MPIFAVDIAWFVISGTESDTILISFLVERLRDNF